MFARGKHFVEAEESEDQESDEGNPEEDHIPNRPWMHGCPSHFVDLREPVCHKKGQAGGTKVTEMFSSKDHPVMQNQAPEKSQAQ